MKFAVASLVNSTDFVLYQDEPLPKITVAILPYTGELIQQLKKHQRIEDVFINTRIAVEDKSGGEQSPWELARLRGIYYLIEE